MDVNKKIKAGIKLYRYDVVEPPKEGWETSYKSPIYIWDYEGPKNEIGAFFLFDNKKGALDIGKIVLDRKDDFLKSFNPQLSIWLTETTITKDIQMLDLTECKDVVDMYITLWKEHINVFRSDFYKFDRFLGSKPLSQLLDDVSFLANGNTDDRSKRETCKCNIYNFYDTYDDKMQLSFACQELTDFSNGSIFKMILENKGLDGYIFKESKANTFCFFNSNCLAPPKTRELKYSMIPGTGT